MDEGVPLMPIFTFSLPPVEVEVGGWSIATALMLPSALMFSALVGALTICDFRVLIRLRLEASVLHFCRPRAICGVLTMPAEPKTMQRLVLQSSVGQSEVPNAANLAK